MIDRQFNSYKILISLAIFVLIGNIYLHLYILQEKYIYFWDIAGYWLSGVDFANILFSHPIEAFKQIYTSIFNLDYNLLPILPLSITAKLISQSHKVYTFSIYNFYVIPFIIVTLLLIYRM